MNVLETSTAGTLESSDIMITLEPGGGGIEIKLQSIVEKQFGRDIRRAIEETLTELEIKSARITAVDKGALDCTIRARTKTAAFRSCKNVSYEWKAPEGGG
ncbi:MAG: citrate lyase acyl carrier protein [Treponema sp.]|jgi:citrate lyase subunit gamma (acyl carrier protein)|nr:citrate lyase acyl carrier protein [Treponema sp.]